MSSIDFGILRRCINYWELLTLNLFSVGAQYEYSWKKILSGVAAFLLGLIFFLVGIVIHLRARKGNEPLRTLSPALRLPWFMTFPASGSEAGKTGCTSQGSLGSLEPETTLGWAVMTFDRAGHSPFLRIIPLGPKWIIPLSLSRICGDSVWWWGNISYPCLCVADYSSDSALARGRRHGVKEAKGGPCWWYVSWVPVGVGSFMSPSSLFPQVSRAVLQ